MKTVIRYIFLKQILSIQKNYLIFIGIYHFYLKVRKPENVKLCCSYKGFKTCTKSRINTKKVDRAIQFYQKAWLKPDIDINTELRKKTKNDFEKDFFKLINNAVFGKTMENVRNQKDIKLVTKEESNQPQSLVIIHQITFQTFDGDGNEKNKSKNE